MSPDHKVDAVAHVELRKCVSHMCLDRDFGDRQFVRDLRIGTAFTTSSKTTFSRSVTVSRLPGWCPPESFAPAEPLERAHRPTRAVGEAARFAALFG